MVLPRTISLFASSILLGAALAAAGCGSGAKLLPSDQASSLDGALQRVSEATSAGECARALSELKSAQAIYASLPPTVDDRLAARIKAGLAQLAGTVPTQCAAAGQTPVTPAVTTDSAPPTTTSTPSTTTTTTTPTTTTTTTPTTTTTAPTTTAATPNGGTTPDQSGTQTGKTP